MQKERLFNFRDENVIDKPVKRICFPHSSIRPSQAEMMRDVNNALENRRHLIADAPTGLGKTAASLFPALDFAVKTGKTVFFLTSRLSQHKMAVETLQAMKNAGSSFSAVDVVGKKHLCSHDVKDMDSSMFSNFCSAMIKDKRCDYYKNFRRKDLAEQRAGLMKTVMARTISSQEAVSLLSNRFCTYEMLMDAAKSADAIIGDYFHLFGMGDKFLKRMGKELKDAIIIIDEAHNLAPRLRSYLSSQISTRTCELAAKEAGKFGEGEAREYAGRIGKVIQNVGSKYLFNELEIFLAKEELTDRISEIADYDELIAKLTVAAERILEERKRSFIDRVAAFLHAWKGQDFGYARILSRERLAHDHIRLQYNCLDPSLISRSIIHESHSTILMSGTMSPMEMHRDLLGLEAERTEMMAYASPFPRENRKNIIVTGVTTKYKERNAESYSRIARTVALSVYSIKGNAAVFFPSYEMMKHIHELAAPDIRKHIILEDSAMTKEERDRVKEEMEKHAVGGAVLFGVMGGSFSEGIDLPGELLNGVVIVGLPLEKPDLSVQALIDYYDERFRRGMAYGYTYPAMIKVMQAAGRCIRGESDRGVIVFADERFTWRNYRYIFPRTWDFVVTERPETEIKRFFDLET